jgi:exopolyphosphatase/guanosine-5'-triphosphate,3'-diphosphate pyrophosphatase
MMKHEDSIPQYDSNHYAVVDLGSNSFHLLITHLVNNKFETANKVKRKVRLAAGLDNQNKLNEDAIERGLDCLSLFAKHLSTIPKENIRIVATATLRIATNNRLFLQSANKILPININLLSGEQEANTIYSGVAHTCKALSTRKRLVIDIGGASTELIIGEGHSALHAVSMNLGCVSFNEKYFSDGTLSLDNFARAIVAAKEIIKPQSHHFIKLGWQTVLGSSGTMQALAEILSAHQLKPVITAEFLHKIKLALIACQSIDDIANSDYFSDSLRADRIPVLASGLSILITLFECLDIKALNLSSGALREGLLYEMLPST